MFSLLLQRIRKLTQPDDEWGPALKKNRTGLYGTEDVEATMLNEVLVSQKEAQTPDSDPLPEKESLTSSSKANPEFV